MGTDHELLIILVSKYPAVKQLLIRYYGQKDIDKQLEEQKQKGTLTEQKLKEMVSNFMKVKDQDRSLQKELMAIMKNNAIKLQSVRNRYIKENMMENIECYSKMGSYITISTKQQLKQEINKIQAKIPAQMESIEQCSFYDYLMVGARDLYKKALQMMQNQGEQCYLIIDTNY